MDVLEAIKTRRSINRVKDIPVSKEMIEKILEAGTYAPNYHLTNPWRFFVLTGEGRKRLGDVFVEIEKSKLPESELENSQEKLEKLKNKTLRAPVVIVVGVEPSKKPKVLIKEEYAAVNSCIQNMLLAAHSLGLGAIWRTGARTYHPKVRDFFNLSENGEIVAFLYLGYPDMTPPERIKPHFSQFTKWIEE
ncbi:nitroreductase [Schinkia azotoformans MEV2011]|uniref:Putative NAD(P)H nitroreductase n=1 Tax=Schinkia azotoformans MEV2011 TaxID=1348973 RepID=A0A072NH85_SCHAZ|nr:nitroreductase [Schinkia azotoformans]KEF36896.1 nitroreductase [Schinkia azotoformans MEV2011]MEC1697077.1 nitroreductase [Schinkia azotoformans]MEC1717828.1 nitroreductase [Schinkia azotoformans]MEC1726368.1 nitroreductase [Schinkia azotoformans]MEC1739677.1 nitroreductase [Schinkia azotoformans]